VNWQVVARLDRPDVSQRAAGSGWSYWYGRALAAQGEETGSRAYYPARRWPARLLWPAGREELGYMVRCPIKPNVPARTSAAAKRDPGIRALELIRLGLRTEGVREWSHTIRFFDDARLIAAAEVAHRAGIYDRVIETPQDRPRAQFSLRYPVPVQGRVLEYAKTYMASNPRPGCSGWWCPGEPLPPGVALERRSDRPDAAHAAHARYVAAKLRLRNYRPHHMTECRPTSAWAPNI